VAWHLPQMGLAHILSLGTRLVELHCGQTRWDVALMWVTSALVESKSRMASLLWAWLEGLAPYAQ